ncbi:scyllo-inosose 3-dehydrogenase [Infirmifilum sp. NZ]|uniref:scyllo-inosose 3-dehydrogenase n=1 Tax=Infirmifilum sp. NZ TaxID=2926850 RepID=UPI00279B065C|nr:scyllo-inosose 3-dehydrogenase [Infirmifilum sp. NZ]UNQ72904.1 alcohol dehydrogenase catalytic domain-containing protein [Infirmifilum sp. NZ]
MKEDMTTMRAALVYADFSPRPGYKITPDELRTHKVREGNKVWKNPKLVLRTDYPVPEPKPDEILIRVKAVGICGSDIHFLETDEEGYIIYPGLTKFPVVIGHEFSGVVEKVGANVRDLKPGDMVTSEEMFWCGECDACRGIDFNHCVRLNDPADLEFGELGFTHDGAMADYVVVKAKYAWKINSLLERYGSEDKAFEAGSLVEPTSVAYHAMFTRAGGFKPGSYVVVWGAGPIGLAAIALAKAAGAGKIISFEVSPVRRELAKKVGADYVFNPVDLEKNGVQPWEKILEITDGQGADFHVEAAGSPQHTLPQIQRSIAIDGKITWIGRAPKEVPIYIEVFQVRRGQLFGSQGHSGFRNFGNVIRLMAAGRIDMTQIITSRFKLDEVHKAFERAHQRIDGKITLKP